MSQNLPSKSTGPKILFAFLIVVEIPLGYWLSSDSTSDEKLVPGILFFAVVIAFLIIFTITFKLSKVSHPKAIHLPRVIVTFSPLKLAVNLDSKKCTYKILKNNAEEIASGQVVPVPGGEESWQITIPKDIVSNDDTVELTLVDESNTTWKIKSFYPHVTKQTAIAEDEEQ